MISRPSKQGFDIVIGNPPYIRRTSLPAKEKSIYKSKYISAYRQYDMYILFIELGTLLLAGKGNLCYINPLRFFNSDAGLKIREFISKNNRIKRIIDVSQIEVFKNAMTYPCILLIEKNNNMDTKFLFTKVSNKNDLILINKLKTKAIDQNDIASDGKFRFLMLNSKENEILNKIESKSNILSSIFSVARGLPNDKFEFNGNEYQALKSTNVEKYRMNGNTLAINTEYGDRFIDEMIILPRTVLYLKAMIKPKGVICLDRIYYLLSKKGKVDLKYYLGVINSRVVNFWFNLNYWCEKISGNYFDLNGNQILSLIIPNCDDEDKNIIHRYVDSIIKEEDNNTQKLLDHYLYHYFKFTQDEIEIIESDNYPYM